MAVIFFVCMTTFSLPSSGQWTFRLLPNPEYGRMYPFGSWFLQIYTQEQNWVCSDLFLFVCWGTSILFSMVAAQFTSLPTVSGRGAPSILKLLPGCAGPRVMHRRLRLRKASLWEQRPQSRGNIFLNETMDGWTKSRCLKSERLQVIRRQTLGIRSFREILWLAVARKACLPWNWVQDTYSLKA